MRSSLGIRMSRYCRGRRCQTAKDVSTPDLPIIPICYLTDTVVSEPVTMIPIARNPSFVGREELLCQLDEELSVTQHYQSRASLCGLGGVG